QDQTSAVRCAHSSYRHDAERRRPAEEATQTENCRARCSGEAKQGSLAGGHLSTHQHSQANSQSGQSWCANRSEKAGRVQAPGEEEKTWLVVLQHRLVVQSRKAKICPQHNTSHFQCHSYCETINAFILPQIERFTRREE